MVPPLVERLAQSFRTTEVEPRDQHGFLNSLYVYPTLLVMPSSRNFAVRVQLYEASLSRSACPELFRKNGYHLRDVSMATEILDWLRVTYVFESWYP
jgi:hypothetical protein